ncbi:MAG TPA: FISUMP domain-containing protein, partial [Bacteroidia bacterium]|nr:FISUMP domain-containing protein [Bacteroidia bacterium]
MFALVLLTFNACKKDEDSDSNSTNTSGSLFGSEISVTVKGRVCDANGTAISGALVKSGNVNSTTDVNGVFILNNISANQKLGCVTVEKAGYFKGVRSFVPKSGGNELQIRLLTKTVDGSINSSTGGTVTIQNGSVTLPPNGVMLNNTAYTGIVKVAIKHFNPSSANFNEEMPGSLVGVTNNTVSGLTSYGMLGVELTDNNGQLLQIANGKTATLTFKVPTGLQASAPSSIDLWSLDETNGYWKKEGVANLVNNEYVGEVGHFSFWNCDVSSSFIYINGQVVNSQTQQPMQGALVTITSIINGSASDYTNGNGEYSGYVPNGVSLSITVSVNCSGGYIVVYSGTLPPMSLNTNIAPISVTLPGQTILTGIVVDCNNQPLANSYVAVNNQVVFTNNGQFNANVCGTNCSVTGFGNIPWVGGQSQTVILSVGTQSIGNLVVCSPGGSTVTDIDGNVYSTVVIGTQEWMQENLKTSHYKNGVLIPTGLSDAQWSFTTNGAYAVYNDSTSYNAIYGKLYNWYAVADPNGLCPTGWHEPEDWEWNLLIKYIDTNADTTCVTSPQSQIAGGAMKEIGLTNWISPNAGATNSSGFTG